MTDDPSKPANLSDRAPKFVHLDGLPARIRIETPTRDGNVFEIGLSVELYEVPNGGGDVLAMPARTDPGGVADASNPAESTHGRAKPRDRS